MERCPNCRRRVPPDAQFCPECDEPLGELRLGDRGVVTLPEAWAKDAPKRTKPAKQPKTFDPSKPPPLAYRAAAFMIDIGIAALATLVVSELVFQAGADKAVAQSAGVIAALGVWWLGMPGAAAINHGRTPGKQAAGIRVERRDLQPLTFPRLFFRDVLARGVFYLLPGTTLFDHFWMLLDADPQQRTLHDRMTGTRVLPDLPSERQTTALSIGLTLTAVVWLVLAVFSSAFGLAR